MIKNVTRVMALASVLLFASCKDKSDVAVIKTDEHNMVVPEDMIPQSEMTEEHKHMNVADYPVVEIENNGEFDFGTINEGDKVEHTFVVKNTGKTDLLIVNAKPSCGCTVPEWTKEPIQPGKTGEVKIVFNSAGKPGQQSKQINLETNTATGHEVINFKANVTPKTK
jgi:inner membrane protein involved in colicin E2 resistance